MTFYLRKGQEYSSSSQLFTLDEIEAKLRAGEIEPTWQCRAEGEQDWKEVWVLTSAKADTPRSSASGRPQQNSAIPRDTTFLLEALLRNQEEQIRLLRAIRWAIVGFNIWFIIQFWFLPKIMLSLR